MNIRSMYWHSIVMVCSLLVVQAHSGVRADAPLPTYDRVHLTAMAVREVANDEMHVVLAAEQSGQDPAKLADTINRDMAWAVAQIKQVPESKVTYQTRAYHTVPNYVQGRINGWVSSQELVLRSRDPAALTPVIGDLQARLLMRSMRFSVSKAVRTQVEDELIGEAMQAFKRRADLIRDHMQNRDYRIVELHINTQFGGGYRAMAQAMPMARAAAETMAAPTVESGNSDVKVTVTGSVEFQLP